MASVVFCFDSDGRARVVVGVRGAALVSGERGRPPQSGGSSARVRTRGHVVLRRAHLRPAALLCGRHHPG